jgi:hypothetical protein
VECAALAAVGGQTGAGQGKMSLGASPAGRFFGDSATWVMADAWSIGTRAATRGAPTASALPIAPTAVHFTTESATAESPDFEETATPAPADEPARSPPATPAFATAPTTRW